MSVGKTEPCKAAWLPHQPWSSPGNRAVDSALHRAWRHRARRLQRSGHDRRGCQFSAAPDAVPPCRSSRSGKRRALRRPEVKRSPSCSLTTFNGRDVHQPLGTTYPRRDAHLRRLPKAFLARLERRFGIGCNEDDVAQWAGPAAQINFTSSGSGGIRLLGMRQRGRGSSRRRWIDETKAVADVITCPALRS